MRSLRVLPVAAVMVLLAGIVAACGEPDAHHADGKTAAMTISPKPTTAPVSASTRVDAASRPMGVTTMYPQSSAAGPSTTQARTSTSPSVRKPTGEQVWAVGDSVMVASESNLESLLPGIAIDAVVGRGVDEGLGAVHSYAEQGLLRDRVVFELGTNSPFSVEEFDELVQTVDGRPLVVVTNHCDRCSWTVTNNAVLQQNCDAAVRCTVADWESVAQQNPQFFAEDGIHVAEGGEGAQALAELIVAALEQR